MKLKKSSCNDVSLERETQNLFMDEDEFLKMKQRILILN